MTKWAFRIRDVRIFQGSVEAETKAEAELLALNVEDGAMDVMDSEHYVEFIAEDLPERPAPKDWQETLADESSYYDGDD